MKTKKELLKLNEALELGLKQGNTKFKYGVKKNMLIISNEIESLKAAKYGDAPNCKEVEEIKNEIYQKYGESDPTNPNILVIPYFAKNEDGSTDNTKLSDKYIDSQKEFNSRLEGIKETLDSFNNKIEDYNSEIETYNKMLEEEITNEFEFFNIDVDNVPDTFIDLDILMDFGIVK